MYYAFIFCFGALSAVLLTVMGFKIMQMLQLSSYRMRGLADWFKSTKAEYSVRYFSVSFFSTIAMLVYVGCFRAYKYALYAGLLFYILFCVLFIFVSSRKKGVTPLRFTPRIVRLIAVTFLCAFFASTSLMYAGGFIPIKYCTVGLLPMFIPLIVAIAYYILYPFEALNNRRYVSKARKKLAAMPSLLKIGITGSYGKTTAKNILAEMLSAKYNVLVTPSSYNTPLGIARTVNYELTREHTVFIAEMGARYKGDIAELARIVRPDIGVVTAVGAQHLATFKSVENVAATKYELIEELGDNGIAVFSSDNEYTAEMYRKTDKRKFIAGKPRDGAVVTYDDVSFGPHGTEFTLTSGNNSARAVTRLLGRHVPVLVSLCAAVALQAGVEFGDIVNAVRDLEPVEHRLQLIANGDVTVLDDAYNSNSEGAANALEVLKSFEGTRIIITPGLVEMGVDEERANVELGAKVFGGADYAYFVGTRANWLVKGATDAGMAPERITVCATRDEAVAESAKIIGKKTILFENDLPDNL